MGNQGTTNWKLGALFTIALMLVAGLFSNAAMAQSGAGTIALSGDSADVLNDAAAAGSASFIPAGKNNHKMEFTFTTGTAATSLADGEVQIKFPAGWAASSAGGEFAPQAIATAGDVLLVGTRFSGASVIIPLTKGAGDAAATDAPATVVITFGVNVPAKRGAHDFTVLSKTKNGRFTKLTGADPDGIITVRVGPRDSITVTPGSVLGNQSQEFTIAYVPIPSGGPTDEGTDVQIKIPQGWTLDASTLDNGAGGTEEGWSLDGQMLTRAGMIGDPATLNTDNTATVMIAIPNLFGSFEFTTQSKSAMGKYTKLDDHDGSADDDFDSDGTDITDPQPDVIVGNIAPGMGMVAITPASPIEGDRNVEFKITFTAAGRMVTNQTAGADTPDDTTDDVYSDRAGIRIVFPFVIAASTIKSVTGGGVQPTNYSVTTPNLDITIPHLNKGQTIVITTNLVDLMGLDPVGSAFALAEATLNPADADGDGTPNEATDDEALRKSSFGTTVATTTGAVLDYTVAANALTNATDDAEVTGGLVKDDTDPGKLTVAPTVVEKDKAGQSITITYEALRTHFSNDVIKIRLPSEIDATTIGKGANLTPSSGTTLEHAADSPYIKWTVTSQLNRGSKLMVRVAVDVPDSTDDLVFNYITDAATDAAIAFGDATGTPGTPGTSFTVTVVGKAEDVRVEVVDLDNGNPIDPSFTATSKQTIGFRFTAENTNIEDSGYFKITLPSNWAPVSRTGSSSAAKVMIHETLTTKAIRDALPKTALSASGRTITVRIDDGTTKNRLKKGQSITVQYGVKVSDAKDYRATMPNVAGEQMIRPEFKAYTGLTEYDLPSITAKITRVADGSGTARITPTSVRAGSSDTAIQVTYTAQGAMGGGAVRLTIPDGWGPMQHDDAAAKNHIAVRSSIKDVKPNYDSLVDGIIVADLPGDADNPNKFRSGNTLTFVFGGAPGGLGAKVQNDVGVASFMIQSDGDGDGGFGDLTSTTAAPTSNAKGLGQIYKGANGALKVDVTSGADGSGTAKVDIVSTSVGKLRYDGPDGAETYQIHAADDVQLKFTYTANQRVQDGQLILRIPRADGWTSPQDLTTGDKGYTTVDSPAGATQQARLASSTVTIDIVDLSPDEMIVIHYGAGSSTVDAPSDIGQSRFGMSIKGSATGSPVSLDTDPLTINVRSQASGAGTAEVSVTGDDLHAGDMDRMLQIVYTAAGQMDGGDVKLTIPKAWSDPEGTADTGPDLEVTPAGSHDEVMFDADASGNHTVVAMDVDLAAGGSLTFRYNNVMVQPTRATAVQFTVAVFGGDQPFDGDDGTMNIADLSDLVVEVEAARAGSGMAMVDPMFVDADGDEATLTFTYTAAGDIFYPSTVMVEVPTSWDQPTSGDRATDEGRVTVAGADERPPSGRKMVARVTQGTPVAADGTITFTYKADPPTRAETSMFKVYFNGEMVGDPLKVLVQPEGGATQIAILDVDDLSVDEDEQMPVMVTVQLQADDGSPAVAEADVEVTLTSDSPTGMFVADPEAADAMYDDEVMITIAAGMWYGKAYYKDSTLGMNTITAMATGYDDAPMTVTVSTEVPALTVPTFMVADSDGVMKTGDAMYAAMEGDMITVTVMANRDQMVTARIGTVDAAPANMMESTTSPGTYTREHTLAAGSAQGSHTITVYSGSEEMAAENMLIVDDTDPAVTDASAEPATVKIGSELTITAMVTESGSGVSSVMANVSMLYTEEADPVMVMLTDDDNDGTYIGTHDVSADNIAANGEYTIDVTAMDNAGNSGMDSATVMLENAVSFTSMIPSGVSLFHVPLDDPDFNTIGDLRAELGTAVNSLVAYDDEGRLEPSSDSIAIAGGRGIIVSLSSEATITFEGEAWGDGTAMISLEAGDANLIGLPLMVEGVEDIHDIMSLDAVIQGVYPNLTDFVAAEGDTGDGPVAGDAAYYVVASAAANITVTGDAWRNSAGAATAPIALSGYEVNNQTPVLSVFGSVVDEITGAAKEGFRVKVKNLTTKAAVSEITSVETEDGYSVTLLDLANAHAARVGDVLEISADSPNPLIGVQPVRHVVTVDDVKGSTIQLENLIAYEIPAETELLRNYPNPFNPETWIPYHLSEDADVSLTIYDANGALVRSIDVGHQTAAKYDTRSKAIYWDGRNQFGEQVASGIYFYSLEAGDFSATRKMVILK